MAYNFLLDKHNPQRPHENDLQILLSDDHRYGPFIIGCIWSGWKPRRKIQHSLFAFLNDNDGGQPGWNDEEHCPHAVYETIERKRPLPHNDIF